MKEGFGSLTGHAIGRLMKETVRRAMMTIRRERLIFEATAKQGYSGNMDDVFTSADKKAQDIYIRAFDECFPDFGIIAEEDGYRKESRNGAYFTVDPLDGTKAYVRRQSHGVSTMVALVHEGAVIAAYVGDVNTLEIYGYRPGSAKVHRITDLDFSEHLNAKAPENRGLANSYALLREPARDYGSATRHILPKFKNHEVMGSSIGTWAARLWKGEVQALILPKGKETPWDSSPVIGISKKMGFEFHRPVAPGSEWWKTFNPEVPTEVIDRSYDLLIMRSDLLQ